MLDKLTLAWSILRTKSYVILTDTKAKVLIPLADLSKFDNVILLTAQTAALQDFKSRLMELIKEHEEQINTLQEQEEVKSGRSK